MTYHSLGGHETSSSAYVVIGMSPPIPWGRCLYAEAANHTEVDYVCYQSLGGRETSFPAYLILIVFCGITTRTWGGLLDAQSANHYEVDSSFVV